jgi:hypothetical protein
VEKKVCSHVFTEKTEKNVQKKMFKKKLQNFHEIVVRQFVNYCTNHRKKWSFSPLVTASHSESPSLYEST